MEIHGILFDAQVVCQDILDIWNSIIYYKKQAILSSFVKTYSSSYKKMLKYRKSNF